jgi:hypothetical protein
MELIGSVVANGTSADIAFNNVPQHYQDLLLIVHGRANFSGVLTTYSVYLNNAIFGLTSGTFLTGDGSSIISARVTGGAFGANVRVPGIGVSDLGFRGVGISHIPSYTSNKNKLVLSSAGVEINTSGAGNGVNEYSATLYRDTSPITIVRAATNGAWVGGSLIELYGIRAG